MTLLLDHRCPNVELGFAFLGVVYISKKPKTVKANYGPFVLETAFVLCYPSLNRFVRVVQGPPGMRNRERTGRG